MPNEISDQEKKPRAFSLGDVVAGVSLLLLVLLFYLPAINGGFVFDDDRHVTPEALRSWHGLWRIWFEIGASFQYYPVLHTAFWIEHRLWGDAVRGYHLANIILHVGSAWMLAAIVRRLGLRGAWLAAFLFALHPVCVESVAWISEQKNTLSTLFYFAAAFVYLGFDRKRSALAYLLASSLFLLALLTKTVAATLPGALLVVLWWRRGGLEWKRDFLPLLPWLIIGAAGGAFSGWMERKFYGAHGVDFSLTLLERCLLASRALFFYLGKTLWPSNLMFHYPLWKVNAGIWWWYLFPVGLLAIAGAGIRLACMGKRGPLAGFLYFGGSLFPVLGFFNIEWFVFSQVADHFLYAALPGIVVPLSAWFAAGLRTAGPVFRRTAAVVAGIVMLVLSSLTWRQSQMYRDMETLYQVTLANNPGSARGHFNYGLVLLKIPGRLSEALGQFEEALMLKTDDPVLYENVGAIFLTMPGRLPDAIADFEAALKLKPDYAEAHCYLATALASTPGKTGEAVAHYQTALREKPDYAEAHYCLGKIFANQQGKSAEAITHYEAALRIKPGYPEAHCALADALANQPGKEESAIAHYETALQIKPDYAEAHYNLANLLAKMPGKLPEAITHYEAALRLRPDLRVIKERIKQLRESAVDQRSK